MRAFLLCLLVSSAALAEDPCKGIDLKKGRVTTGMQLSPFYADKPPQQACVDAIGKALAARKQLISATVTVRVPDNKRLDGKALDGGKKTAAALVTAGVPQVRINVVAPRAEADETPIILVLFTDKPPRPIARVDLVEGNATWAEEGGPQQPLKQGDFVEQGIIIRMKGSDSFRMSFAEGSTMVLEPDSILRIVTIEAAPTRAITVELELVQGGMQLSTAAAAPGSVFKVSAGDANVALDHAQARIRRKEGVLHTEVLKGAATVASKNGTHVVGVGQGTRALADGNVEPARPLLGAPVLKSPLLGDVKPNAKLQFDPVEGAAFYRIEFANDAAFSHDPSSVTGTELSTRIPQRLKKGKTFWRVVPIDKDGVWGQPSRIYAFTK